MNVNDIAKLGSNRFERFSSWMALVRAIARLKHLLSSVYSGTFHGWHSCVDCKSVHSFEEAQKFIIRVVQRETSSILTFNPVLDNDGLPRVGGRLSRANINSNEKNPIIIPGKHYLAMLIVRYCHELVFHQVRHFTEGAVRSAGFWIIGGRRVISSMIFQCFKCRKLRARVQIQQISDMPVDRLTPTPPFTFVGLDVFGPWSVVARRTKGGLSHSKCWAVLFTCLTIRAIHIEVITDMSSSSFINALRRFIALRGHVKVFRSDNGTNFVGSTNSLKINVINTEHGSVNDFLLTKGSVWIFNQPHSSHMGGVWERMVGTTRRILDSTVLETKAKDITIEVVSTHDSSGPESSGILSPSALLTHKTESANDSFSFLDITDMYKAQWKRVQVLAEIFWNKWRREYLQTLQTRRKWQTATPNLSENDVVLLKDKSTHRNEWPVGLVTRIFPSEDNMVRKTEVRIMKDGKQTTYLRPITELVLLQSASQ
ncbi:unnamed protein product [Mytilus coruscus]|uniref:Integrase catalytic domain-containing protein n=1 Tax=Mytilus coruscus TaxID=42192 RepID=A0A6J8CXN8_MYTCO|nr:unnamed protein product [Mytilus coruscus]